MNYLKKIIIFSILASSFLWGDNDALHRSDQIMEWSQGNKHFTTSFYPYAANTNRNFVFSPVSLQLGLAMTSELALGKTHQEILQTMMLPSKGSIRRKGANTILKQLNTGVAIGCEPVSLTLANGIWISSKVDFFAAQEKIFNQVYLASLQQADFENSAEYVREEINRWVEDKTAKQITDFMPPGVIDNATRLVLVNTLYMRAPWEEPFNPEMTYEAPFFGLEKSLKMIPYMQRTGMFGFLNEFSYNVIEIPFKNSLSTQSALAMFIVLPKEGVPLEEVEKKFTTRRLDHWLEDIQTKYLALSLPKFRVATALNAKGILKEMGMELPFSSEAEFAIGGCDEKLAVTDILHNAVLEIDEDGGTGSAATGIVIGVTCIRDPAEAIVVNRPFLVIVADKTTGIILFAGRIIQP